MIVKELPGRTAAEGTPVCEIDDENWAYALLHQDITSSEIATDHKDRITDVRIVSPSDRTVPISVRFSCPGSFLCRLEDRTDVTPSRPDCNEIQNRRRRQSRTISRAEV